MRMWQSSEQGCRKLDESELRLIENGLEQWTTIESESLNRVVTGDETAPAGNGETMPDALDASSQ